MCVSLRAPHSGRKEGKHKGKKEYAVQEFQDIMTKHYDACSKMHH